MRMCYTVCLSDCLTWCWYKILKGIRNSEGKNKDPFFYEFIILDIDDIFDNTPVRLEPDVVNELNCLKKINT